ncbi:EAL domain-containing protein [Lichenibacterium minor]|uniref:EAL domain-containing protein n=1 Tax=Lichenibacterium minor TaxID=2316528 RepID=A0A4V1RTW0_9HYPH|nr:EAL domain-containing protein [Lichenibacterium minor]
MLADEDQRLASLAEYGVAPDDCQEEVGLILDVAQRLFDVNTVLVSFVERDRVIFPARLGLDVCVIDRGPAFCSHTLGHVGPLVVLDTGLDPRFHDNPFVIDGPRVRFYAGAPLVSPSGHTLGTLCLLDASPRNAFSHSERDNLVALAALVLDKLESRRLMRAGQVSQNRFEQIAATSPDGILCADHDGLITFWNTAAERLFGFSAAEALGRSIDLIIPDRMKGGHGGGLSRVAQGGAPRLVGRSVELPAQRKDGTEFPIELSLSMWWDQERANFGSIVRDITERRRDEDRLHRLAHFDPLTELPNRVVLRRRIEDITKGALPAAVLIVDLDGFKHVNDYFGHSAGDLLLRDVASRLLACVRPRDTVARLGGDEFAVLLAESGDEREATEVADRIVSAMTKPFQVDEQPVNIGTSVGIALYPSHGETVDDLMSHADLALYDAKAGGRDRHCLFDVGLKAAVVLRRTLEVDLRHAVEADEFELFYQPQVRAGDGALTGAEALLRWRHPERGLQPPSAFLPALEGSSLAARVGGWVLRTACLQAARWRREGAPNLVMGVNLFGVQCRGGDLATAVRLALRTAELPASALELEITENIVLQNDGAALRTLRELKQDGVGIAFDDYGTGFASLSLLKTYPVTRLKIDQSFVRRMADSPQDVAIVRAVTMLGRAFGLSIIAEGVETQAQRDLLVAEGCDEIQGYLFGRPMPAPDFASTFGLTGARGTIAA